MEDAPPALCTKDISAHHEAHEGPK
jgi:hypothetical protein